LAGGTDLLGLMKKGLIVPERLVNLKTIPGLDQVVEAEDGWHIGAMTSLSRLAAFQPVARSQELSALREALLQSASPQLRHMATIGGNLVQRPRCWYYRSELTPCWRKGGQRCFAFRGENKYHVILDGGPCYAVFPSDPAVALVALDGVVVIAGPSGRRSIPLSSFYRLPTRENRQDTVLEQDELVVEVFVPRPAPGSRGTYVKVAERGSWDFSLVSVAVQLTLSEEVVRHMGVVMGGVAPVPWRAVGVEQALAEKPLSPETIEQAAELATQGARPLEQNGYKVELAQAVVRQALQSVREGEAVADPT
jgi:xanthine dehydrogenase YagS FAD-binding subunit